MRLILAGEARVVAVEDAALYRDALGARLPTELSAVWLGPTERPLLQLLLRFAATHGPFTAAAAAERWGLVETAVQPLLQELEAKDGLVSGEFVPGGVTLEWCDCRVLQRIRRQTLEIARKETAPVDAPVLARFLVDWHRLAEGDLTLEEAIDRLEGLPVAFSELTSRILPMRVRGFKPADLSQLTSTGRLVWTGAGTLGKKDGRARLFWRDNAAVLLETPATPELNALHHRVLDHLSNRGASFLFELASAVELPGADVMAVVWAGPVSNDSLEPLRSLAGAAPKRRASRGRRRPARATTPTGGRWWRVSDLIDASVESAERAHLWVETLLQRHGLLSREALAGETETRWGNICPVLRAMDEVGQVRRGYFVDGLSGGQFARPAVVDRLRTSRKASDDVVALAVTDPACPWGSSIPWPQIINKSTTRDAGATVVLVGGEP